MTDAVYINKKKKWKRGDGEFKREILIVLAHLHKCEIILQPIAKLGPILRCNIQ